MRILSLLVQLLGVGLFGVVVALGGRLLGLPTETVPWLIGLACLSWLLATIATLGRR